MAFALALLLAACQGAPPPDARSGAQGPAGLMRVADQTRVAGDLGTAVTLYRRAAELSPNDPVPLGQLGATLAQLRAWTEAAAAYRAALAISPNPIEGDLHRGLAVVLLQLNQPQEALNELSLVQASDDPRFYSTMGVAHDLVGRHDLAQQDYRAGLKLAPNNSGLRNNLGLSLALSGDYAGAEATLGEFAKAHDAAPRHRLNLALVYGLAGDDLKAAAVARTVLDEAAIKNNLAYYALLRGLDDRARANAIMMGQPPGPALAEAPKVAKAEDDQPAAAPRSPVAAANLPSETTAPVKSRLAAKPEHPHPTVPDEKPVETVPAPTQEAPPIPQVSAPEIPPPTAAADASASAPAATPTQLTKPAEAEATGSQTAAVEPPPAAAPAEQAPPASAPTVAAKAATNAGFAVQLGAFASEANAKKLAEQLNRKGYEVAVAHHRDREGRDWFVVRAGGYANAEEAAAAARHLREAERVPAVVVHLHEENQA